MIKQSKYIFIPTQSKTFVWCVRNKTVLERLSARSWESPIERIRICLN